MTVMSSNVTKQGVRDLNSLGTKPRPVFRESDRTRIAQKLCLNHDFRCKRQECGKDVCRFCELEDTCMHDDESRKRRRPKQTDGERRGSGR
jgi:hypothetical protein